MERREFGAELRALRVLRGLSVVAAARRAGVSRVSLHRWEAGEQAPHGQALAALLAALEATPQERASLVADEPPSRAQPVLAANPLGPSAHPGHMLRAFREGRSMTQVQLAQAVGMSRSIVAKWEAGQGMPGEEAIARALAVLEATDAGLREDSLDLYDPLTDPLGARMGLREETHRVPHRLQGAHLLARERELWPLAARDACWESALIETMAWRSSWLMGRGEATAALGLARHVLRLAESSGEWDAAEQAFGVVADVRMMRGGDPVALARFNADAAERVRNPFLRAHFMQHAGGRIGAVDRARGREILDRAYALVRENEPDDLHGWAVDPERFAFMWALSWHDRDEAARMYERLGYADRWEETIRSDGGFGLDYADFHHQMGNAPSERARVLLHETYGHADGWISIHLYNTFIAPWIGTDPIPGRPPR